MNRTQLLFLLPSEECNVNLSYCRAFLKLLTAALYNYFETTPDNDKEAETNYFISQALVLNSKV